MDPASDVIVAYKQASAPYCFSVLASEPAAATLQLPPGHAAAAAVQPQIPASPLTKPTLLSFGEASEMAAQPLHRLASPSSLVSESRRLVE